MNYELVLNIIMIQCKRCSLWEKSGAHDSELNESGLALIKGA